MGEASVNMNVDPALVLAIGASPSVFEGCVYKYKDINEDIHYFLLSILTPTRRRSNGRNSGIPQKCSMDPV